MHWTIKVSTKLGRKIKELPESVRLKVAALFEDLETNGPMLPNWPNFSKLGSDSYHCHLKRGRPTYVACWTADKKEKLIEVTYAGTHEKAPY